jgi:DNA-binding MarR family transcriptional regulator
MEAPLWKLLLKAGQRVEAAFEEELGGIGLSLSKLGVLKMLVDEGEPIPLSRLAGKLACVKSNVTQLVDRLETEGLVVRVDDPADRRSVLAAITDAGRERFLAGVEASQKAETRLFLGYSDEDRRALLELLCRLADCGCPDLK